MGLITYYWSLDLLIFVFLSIVFAYLYMTRNFKYWKKLGVMELPPVAFLGNFGEALTLKKSPGYFVKDLYDAGIGLPYMGFYIFDRPFFLPRDPTLIKRILVKDFNYFSDRFVKPDSKDHIGCSNLFVLKNPAWKHVRSKLTPLYTSGKLKKLFELMLEVGIDLDTYLASVTKGESECVLEMKDIWANYMNDMIGTTAFGLKVNSLNDPDAEFSKYRKKIFEPTVMRGLQFLSMFFIPHLSDYVKATFIPKDVATFLRRVFWNAIDHRIETGTKRNDLIDLLIELRESYKNAPDIDGFTFDGDDLLGQAVIFFNAGFETSSTTVSFTLYEISTQPDLQERLRKEILNALENNDGQMTYDILKALPYLEMIICETLRKYPPLSFLDRVAMADYKIPNSDLIIKKGTPVYIPMLGLHYDPEYFPNPEKYDPERFAENNKENIQQFTYFPFGEGPHNCIGGRLGSIQVKLGLVQILKNYRVSVCDKTSIPLLIDPKGFMTTPLGGIYLKIQKLDHVIN